MARLPKEPFILGVYSSWFATQPISPPNSAEPNLLLSALNYIVVALEDPSFCLHAANALRNLCDANRKALAPHISAFGELHARIDNITASYVFDLIRYSLNLPC